MKICLLKKILIFCIVITVTAIFPPINFSQYKNKTSTKPLDPQTVQLIKKAFDLVRINDFSFTSQLENLGKKIIPYLEPYIFDPNDLVRKEATSYLIRFYTPEGSVLLARILADKEGFYRAADEIYESPKSLAILRNVKIRDGLLKSFSENRYSLTSILLLKNSPGEEIEQALKKVKIENGAKIETLPVQLLPVKISLAADLVLCSINNSNGCKDLADQFPTVSVNEAFFLLLMLDSIKDRQTLQHLQKIMLADTRIYTSTQSELIYKNSADSIRFVQPKSRICDLAVDFLVKRFRIKVIFKTGKETYSKAEITELQNNLNRLFA